MMRSKQFMPIVAMVAMVLATVAAPRVTEAFGRRAVTRTKTSSSVDAGSAVSSSVVKSRSRLSAEPATSASCDVSSGGFQQGGGQNRDIAPVRASASIGPAVSVSIGPARVSSAAAGSQGYAICEGCGKWVDVATGEHLTGPPPQVSASATAGQPEYLPPVSSQTVRVSADGKTGTVELQNVPNGSNIIVQPPGTALPEGVKAGEPEVAPVQAPAGPQASADATVTFGPAVRSSGVAAASGGVTHGSASVKTKSKAVSRAN